MTANSSQSGRDKEGRQTFRHVSCAGTAITYKREPFVNPTSYCQEGAWAVNTPSSRFNSTLQTSENRTLPAAAKV